MIDREELLGARARTIGAGSARFDLLVDFIVPTPAIPESQVTGLMRPLLFVGKAAGKGLWRVAARRFDFRHQHGEGVIDFVRRRFMIDYGHYATLYAGGESWGGRSGRAIATLWAEPELRPTPLWLLDLLAGVVEVADEGTEEFRGVTCQRVAARVDFNRAVAVQSDLGVPAVNRFVDLLSFPITAWVRDSFVRGVQSNDEHLNETMELFDFGVDSDALDWTRLPTFCSPEEAR